MTASNPTGGYVNKEMDGTEAIVFDEHGNIKLKDHGPQDVTGLIMHEWESPLMKVMADHVTKNGGNILEIGFGMGISATHIQDHEIDSHTIIEIHPEIYHKACEWANGRKNTNVILGNWKTVIPTLNTKYDGIFHDTYRDNFDTFLLDIRKICNEGCIVTFFRNSWYPDDFFELVPVTFTEEHMENFPWPDHSRDRSYKNNTYHFKNLYYKNGVFTK